MGTKVDVERLMESDLWADSTPAYRMVTLAVLTIADHDGHDRWDPSRGENVEIPRGTVWATVRDLANQAQVTKSAAQSALDRLRKQGLWKVDTVQRQRTVITVPDISYYVHKPDNSTGVGTGHGTAESAGGEDGPEVVLIDDQLSYMRQDDKPYDPKEIVQRALKCYRREYEQPNFRLTGRLRGYIGDRYEQWYQQISEPVVKVIRLARSKKGSKDSPPHHSLHALMKEDQFAALASEIATEGLGVDEDLVSKVVDRYRELWDVDEEVPVSETVKQRITARHNGFRDVSVTPVMDVLEEARRLEDEGSNFWGKSILRTLTSEGMFAHLFDLAKMEQGEMASDKDVAERLRKLMGDESPDIDEIREETEEVF